MGIHLIEPGKKPDHGININETPFYIERQYSNNQEAEKMWYEMQEHIHQVVQDTPGGLIMLASLHDKCLFIPKYEDALLAALIHMMAQAAHEFIQEYMQKLGESMTDKPNDKPIFQHLGSIQ